MKEILEFVFNNMESFKISPASNIYTLLGKNYHCNIKGRTKYMPANLGYLEMYDVEVVCGLNVYTEVLNSVDNKVEYDYITEQLNMYKDMYRKGVYDMHKDDEEFLHVLNNC